MDYFLYFNVDIGEGTLRTFARSLHCEDSVIPPATGVVSGLITGYQVTATGVSGIVGNPFYISGSGTGSGFYTYPSGAPKTGAVGVSGVFG